MPLTNVEFDWPIEMNVFKKDVNEWCWYSTQHCCNIHFNNQFFRLKDVTRQADRMTKSQKTSAVTFIRTSSCISQMVASEFMDLARFFNKVVFQCQLCLVVVSVDQQTAVFFGGGGGLFREGALIFLCRAF